MNFIAFIILVLKLFTLIRSQDKTKTDFGPFIWDYNYENAIKLSDGVPLDNQLWLLLARDNGDYEKYTPIIEDIAKEFYGKIVFVRVDVSDESNMEPLQSVQARAREAPTMRLIRFFRETMDLYMPDTSGLTKDDIFNFVQEFFDGNLLAEPMSEMLPDDWDEKAVKILTGENFDKFVNNREKDVIVFFYAPW